MKLCAEVQVHIHIGEATIVDIDDKEYVRY